MNVSGSSFETALSPASFSEQSVVLDRILGPNTYRIRSRVMVQRRGNWYEALTLDLYSGTPLVMYFHWLFPPGRGLVKSLLAPGMPPVRTAFAAFGEATSMNPGSMAILIGGALLAAGYVMRKGRG